MKLSESRIKQIVMEEIGPTLEEVMKEMGVEDTGTNYHGEKLPPPDMLLNIIQSLNVDTQ